MKQEKEKEEREEKGDLASQEASHYYGNIAHTDEHRTDAGCHGFAVTAPAKELLYKQTQRSKKERAPTLLSFLNAVNNARIGCFI